MIFYVGLFSLSHPQHFERSFISVNVLRDRRSPFIANKWIMDSGAFSEISKYGDYRSSVVDYATEIERWSKNGELEAAVAQDYMCEPMILRKTGKTVKEHQQLTIERYDELVSLKPTVKIIPVLQGYHPFDYVDHLEKYGDRIKLNHYVGVGSVCKRNTNTRIILSVLQAIKQSRPDIRLHGFGLKRTALSDPGIRHLLHSSDSMAWSLAARYAGRDANSWHEAKDFERDINTRIVKPSAAGAPALWLGTRR